MLRNVLFATAILSTMTLPLGAQERDDFFRLGLPSPILFSGSEGAEGPPVLQSLPDLEVTIGEHVGIVPRLVDDVGGIAWSITPLTPPPGLDYLAQGVIDGSPLEIGDTRFTITADNAEGSDSVAFDLSVFDVLSANLREAPDPEDIPQFEVDPGEEFSLTLEASGGKPPYTFAWGTPSGSRPAWLNLSPTTGDLSGTPEEGEWTGLEVRVSDSKSPSSTPSSVVFDLLAQGTAGVGRLAFATESSTAPIAVYDIQGNDFTLATSPTGITVNVNDIAWSPNRDRIAVATYGDGYLHIQNWNGEAFTRQNPSGVAPNSNGTKVAWSPDGTGIALYSQNSGIITYSTAENLNSLVTRRASILVSGVVLSMEYSPDSSTLAVASNGAPYLALHRKNGNTYTPLALGAAGPTNNASGVSWSRTGEYLAVSQTVTAPFLHVYRKSGSSYTKLTIPDAPDDRAYAVAWAPDADLLAVGYRGSPYLALYTVSGDELTRLPSPTNWTSYPRSLAWSEDGNLLIATLSGSSVGAYSRSGSTLNPLPSFSLPGAGKTVK